MNVYLLYHNFRAWGFNFSWAGHISNKSINFIFYTSYERASGCLQEIQNITNESQGQGGGLMKIVLISVHNY